MLHIHGVPMSVHTRKVIVAALAKSLPYELHPVVPVMPDSLPPGWRSLSPTGMIPVVTDGDFCLADSAAICAYLERTYPAAPLYPTQPQAYGRALWFEHYAGGTLFRNIVHPLFTEVFVRPKVHQQAPDAARIDAVMTHALPEAFGYLESICGSSGFLTGSQMTMGDVAVVSNLITLQYIGFALDAERYPQLAALFARTIMQPAVREAVQREQAAVAAMGLDNRCVAAALV